MTGSKAVAKVGGSDAEAGPQLAIAPQGQDHRPPRFYGPWGQCEFTLVVPGPQPSRAPGWEVGAGEGPWG